MSCSTIRARGRVANSVLLKLDGKESQVHQRYIGCQKHFRDWLQNSNEVKISGRDRVVYTTTGGTFHYFMTYKERRLVLVIDGRKGWLHGYYGIKGTYQFQDTQYMNHSSCISLPFDGNHFTISDGNIGKTSIGLHALRHAFDVIWEYNGGNYCGEDMKKFKKAFGIIVVHICESVKLKDVSDRILQAFVNPTVRKLADEGSAWISDLITNWNSLSLQAMRAIHYQEYNVSSRVKNIMTLDDILTHVTLMHVDAFNLGIFAHQKPPNPLHWEPLEAGSAIVDDSHLNEKHTDDDDRGGDGGQNGRSGGQPQNRKGGERRAHQESKGKEQVGGGRGGGSAARPSHSLSSILTNLVISRLICGHGKDSPMDHELMESVGYPQELVCMVVPCKPAGTPKMVENNPWSQIQLSCSLTSLYIQARNHQPQDLGVAPMTLGGWG